ncbi:hypothetical protein D3875_22590 [Deinococcus cavernae]|uniref:Protein kinase domain-containing protein n=1 Tax=Deinococcus cavernae TaxID=2320857 RepID=A0A418V079_9DEIO|nr:protein kinase [Deinococcus cavernae]RJF69110.1 hypothetical protein D3875_22590 [Deinococcus cavernae]
MLEQSPPQRPELRQRLAGGWLGVIYAAEEAQDGTPLAVRLLAPERLAEVGRLAQVLSFAAQHQHEHILPVTLPSSAGDEVFYLMPQALGGSLRGVFDRYRAAGARVDAATMLDAARQVAQGLDYAHAHGVLHGNLKPENVLLQPLPGPHQDEFRLLLSDFGLNSLRPPDPHSPYLPAPQRAGAAATMESDLYGLGALIFEAVAGRPLPPQPLAADLLDVPEPAAKVVARCLGFSAPFADMTAFLGYLRALQVAGQAGMSGTVHLSTDHSYLDITPGEAQAVRLKLSGESAGPVQVRVEGLPDAWTPSVPPVDVQPGKEALVTLTFQLPRRSSVAARTYDASIVALADLPAPAPATGEAGDPPERLELGRLPLQIRVQPFDGSQLFLSALHRQVGSVAQLSATLRNDGNQTQRYNLEVNLPPGSHVRKGSARRQLELAPGAEFSELLDVRLPVRGLTLRPLTFTALANSVPRPTPAERGDDLPPAESWPPVYNTVQDHLTLEQRPLVPWWALALGITGLLGLGAWAAQPPQIESFAVEGPAPMQGEAFTLAWYTDGARQVQIAELPGQPIDPDGQVRLPGVTQPQTYTLVASGFLTQKKQQVTVTPLKPAPRIDAFKVTPARARLGDTVHIEWKVSHAQQVDLQPFGTVPLAGTREFVMQRDTRLQLTARKGSVPSSADVRSVQTVTLAAPTIRVFTLTPANVLRGQNVTVRWDVQGASRVRLSPLGELPPSGTRTFAASQTANYVLKASNGQQETTASAGLTVRIPQARIEALTVTPSSPVVGQPVKVQWRSRDASRAELRWGSEQQTVAPSGSLTITASRALQSVTLVAENANGVPSMQTRPIQVRVPVLPAPTPSAPAPAARASDEGPSAAAPASRTSSGSQPAQPASGQPARNAAAAPVKRPSPTVTRPTAPRPGAPAASASSSPAPSAPTPTAPASRSPAPRPASQNTAGSSKGSVAAASVSPLVRVQTFAYRPAARAGGRGSLTWRVTGVTRVRIAGLSGPNGDGTFPAIGSAPLPAGARPGAYVLTAANGAVRATAQVPASLPGDSAYPGLTGTWNHSFGQMNLSVKGSRVTGSLLSSRADLPSGTLRGSLTGDASSPTLNAFVSGGDERVALIVRFDTNAHTFDGLYSSRSARVPWCGWKSPAANPCP